MTAALLWGAIAASSLVLGALLGLARQWHDGLIGIVLGFGAGALISSISFELTEEGLKLGGRCRWHWGLRREHWRSSSPTAGRAAGPSAWRRSGWLPLALGALLDGIPEQAVLGIGFAQGQGVSVALLVAIFVSNLPEAIGSSIDMQVGGFARD